jgi:hypothetical protein
LTGTPLCPARDRYGSAASDEAGDGIVAVLAENVKCDWSTRYLFIGRYVWNL